MISLRRNKNAVQYELMELTAKSVCVPLRVCGIFMQNVLTYLPMSAFPRAQ